MARELQYKITVDDAEAKTKVAAFDRSLTAAGSSANTGATSIDRYERSVRSVSQTHAGATQTLDVYEKRTTSAVGSTAKLTTATTTLAEAFGSDYSPALKEIDDALSYFDAKSKAGAQATQSLGDRVLGAAATVGIYGTALAAVTSILVDWWVGHREAALAAETAGAKQDTVNRAIEAGAPKTIRYADAVKYLNEQHAHTQAMIPEVAYGRYIRQLADAAEKGQRLAAEEAVRTQALADHGIVVGTTTDLQKEWADAVRKSEEAARKAAAEHEKLTTSIRGIERAGYDNTTAVAIMNANLDKVGEKDQGVEQLRKEFDALEQSIRRSANAVEVLDLRWQSAVDTMSQNLGGNIIPGTRQIGNGIGVLMPDLKGLGQSSGGSWLEGFQDSLGGLNDIFQRAFEGGGGVKGAIQSSATSFGKVLLGQIPVIGPVISQFSGAIVAGFKKLLNWGGPSEEELAGRSTVADFERQLAGTLTATQRLEAGGESWKQTVIAVRDEYAKVGLSSAQAEADVKALWDSSRGGADAVAAAIATIQGNLDKATAATKDQAAAEVAAGQAQQKRAAEMQKTLDGLMSKRDALWSQIAGEAPEEVMGVIEAGQRAQLAVLDAQIEDQRTQMKVEAEAYAANLQGALESIDPEAVHVPVVWDIPPLPTPGYEAPEYAAGGGFVTRDAIQYFAGGGRVLPFARGTDTVPAMLTPGEGVISRRGMARLGREGLYALNHGGAIGGGAVTVHLNGDIGISENEDDFGRKVSQAAIAALRRRGVRFNAA